MSETKTIEGVISDVCKFTDSSFLYDVDTEGAAFGTTRTWTVWVESESAPSLEEGDHVRFECIAENHRLVAVAFQQLLGEGRDE